MSHQNPNQFGNNYPPQWQQHPGHQEVNGQQSPPEVGNKPNFGGPPHPQYPQMQQGYQNQFQHHGQNVPYDPRGQQNNPYYAAGYQGWQQGQPFPGQPGAPGYATHEAYPQQGNLEQKKSPKPRGNKKPKKVTPGTFESDHDSDPSGAPVPRRPKGGKSKPLKKVQIFNSDTEDDTPAAVTPGKKATSTKTPASTSKTKTKPASETPAASSKSTEPPKQPTSTFPPSAPVRQAKPPSFVKSLEDLVELGRQEKLPTSNAEYKLLKTYVNNSTGTNATFEVKIHTIVKLVEGPSLYKGEGATSEASAVYDPPLLLFAKTTEGTLKTLSKGVAGGPVALYDRAARALAIPPEKVEVPHRQVLVLCAAALGEPHVSDQGYNHWVNKPLPQGCNTVKATGRLVPDFTETRTIGLVQVPLGKTRRLVVNGNLDYDEYIFFPGHPLTPMYAIELEILPEAFRTPKDFSGGESDCD